MIPSSNEKQKSTCKPIVTTRLPGPFMPPKKQNHHKAYDDMAEIEEYKKIQKLLSPLKLGPKERSNLTRVLKQLERMPSNLDNDKLFEPLAKMQNQTHAILPQCQVQLEEMITLSQFPSRSLKGFVRKVLHAPTLGLYIIKQIPINTRDERSHLREWISKWQKYQKKCKYLTEINATFWNSPEGCVSIVAEYTQNASLADIVDTIGSVNEKSAALIAKGALECLSFFHRKNICFGGLVPAHIIVTKKGNVKFTPRHERWLSAPSNELEADIYELGYMILMMLIGELDIFDVTEDNDCCFLHSIQQQFFLSKLSIEARDFLCLCLKSSPTSRGKVGDLLNHPWLSMPHYKGPDVNLTEIISLCIPSGNNALESAEKQLEHVTKALKVVLMGQHYRSESVPCPKELADDLGLSVDFVRDKVHKAFSEL
ncbi:unnamed protein product [Blepharisma stoltei]|uniref:Protein kinase domain-containing protein n=1 Tax=Blepharisma stoltei TaxID=1481888 RepID=A0AAU9JBV8_9CILI|nr:unnamed protein product [Blepharisma stoltei]